MRSEEKSMVKMNYNKTQSSKWEEGAKTKKLDRGTQRLESQLY